MQIVTADQMAEIEGLSLSHDLTLPRLMENSGSAAATFIRRTMSLENIGCVVFSGKGNNGGDGFVVARRLYEYGAHVLLVLVDGESKSPQSQQMYEFLSVMEIPVLSMDTDLEMVEGYAINADLIIDAIYGIGFKGQLSGNALEACKIINAVEAKVISLDCPSGIESDHGQVSPNAVKADVTIAFQFLKPLHILPNSIKLCGEIQTVDIGIPPEIIESIKSNYNIIDADSVWQSLPNRATDSHKGDYGRLLMICGSSSYRGAAVLAANGAFRTGVGLCTLASPENVCQAAVAAVPEVILQPLPLDSMNNIDFPRSLPILEKEIYRSTAVLFGCGVGDSPTTKKILQYLVRNLKVPLVIDADGLTVLSRDLDILRHAKSPIILTPHPGEMARLLKSTPASIQADRIESSMGFSFSHNVYIVLKGAFTLIATPNKELYINPTGGPGLAKAGSGDILAGMISSLLAQGLSPESATTAGVWLHGTAGDRCAKRLSEYAMLPSDILDDLAQLFVEAGK